METIETKPSANHLTAIAVLARSEKSSRLAMHDASLEDIQELVLLFGGELTARLKEDYKSYIYYNAEIGNCSVNAFSFGTHFAILQQQTVLNGFEKTFEKGTKLTIIDNQYFVESYATK
jgi:hypothetical protein